MALRIFQLALFYFLCFANSYGQSVTKRYCCIDVAITKEKKPKKIYAIVENKPSFACGDSSWVQSTEKQINQSIQSLKSVKKGKYLVSVQFIMDKDSSISDIRCLNCPGFGMSEEVIRVLKKGRIKWLPSSRPVIPYRKSAVTSQDK